MKTYLKLCIVLLISFTLPEQTNAQQFNSLNGPWGHFSYSIAFDNSGNPIVGAYEYMWRYDGSVWHKINLLPDGLATHPTVTPFRPILSDSAGTIWQFDHTFGQNGFLWKSTDNGVTWNYSFPNGLPDSPPLCLTFDKDNNLLLGSGRITGQTVGGGIWRSTDQGNNWSLVGTTLNGLDTLNISSIIVKNDTIFAGAMPGIFKSTDNGINWISSGLNNINIWSLTINDNGHIFAGTGTGGNGCYRSTDNGSTWTLQLNIGEYHRVIVSINQAGTIFAADLDGTGIHRSTDNGDTWGSVNNGLLTDLPNGKHVRFVAINSSGTLFAGTTTDGLFKSTNNGDNWIQIGIPAKISATVTKNSYVFVSGNNRFYRSTDNGDNWQRANIEGLVNTIANGNNDTVFAGSESGYGIFMSTNNGNVWQQLTVPSEMNNVLSLAINSNGKIFAGTLGYGIYSSTNSGQTWQSSDGTSNQVRSLAVSIASKNFDYIFAGTSASLPGGIFRSTQTV